VLCFFLLALASLAGAAEENPLGMSYDESEDLHLIYFDSLSFMTPHTVRTFTNSIAWQKKMFGWVPSQRTTVLLKDLSDYGNATAIVAPRSRLLFDIAPQSRAFETNPASERMYSLMNHELIHIAAGDVAAGEDRSWRRFFFGKVSPNPDHPESLLYSYLTIPRYTAPRWMIEGIAVFAETWMNGGIGRAQGGYDEMVFREMVRDNVTFYDPLSLVSRGVRVEFNNVASAYLYGTRFITWLAYAHTPERSLPGSGGMKAASATTQTSSSTCSAFRSTRRGRIGSGSSRISSERTSPRCASFRSRPIASSPAARRAPSRGCITTRRAACSTEAFATRDSWSTSAR